MMCYFTEEKFLCSLSNISILQSCGILLLNTVCYIVSTNDVITGSAQVGGIKPV